MNETLNYLDSHLKDLRVSRIDFAYIDYFYHVDVHTINGEHIRIKKKTLAECEHEIMIAYIGYIPDGA